MCVHLLCQIYNYMVISLYYDTAGTHSNGCLWLDLSLLRINFAGTIKMNYWELKCLN